MSSPLFTPQCRFYTLAWVTFKDNDFVYLFGGVAAIRQANPTAYQSCNSAFKCSPLRGKLEKHAPRSLKAKPHFSSFTLNFFLLSTKGHVSQHPRLLAGFTHLEAGFLQTLGLFRCFSKPTLVARCNKLKMRTHSW